MCVILCKYEYIHLGYGQQTKNPLKYGYHTTFPYGMNMEIGSLIKFSNFSSLNLDTMIELNYNKAIDKVTKDLLKWQNLNLTPIGRVIVIKLFNLSTYLHLCQFQNLKERK